IGAKGAGFKSLAEPWCDTTTPAGELILTVFAGVATFERKRIKERQREGIQAAKKRGGVYKGGTTRFNDADIWVLDAQGLGATEIMRKIGAKSTSTIYRALERKPNMRMEGLAGLARLPKQPTPLLPEIDEECAAHAMPRCRGLDTDRALGSWCFTKLLHQGGSRAMLLHQSRNRPRCSSFRERLHHCAEVDPVGVATPCAIDS